MEDFITTNNTIPKVSVIVPVYNAENTLYDFFEGVIGQDFDDFQLVLINDGSTDKSYDMIVDFAKKVSENNANGLSVIYDTQENQGIGITRNKGLKLATGEFIMFWDPDDIIPPNAISSLYNKILKTNADLVIGLMKANELGLESYRSANVAKKAKIGHFNRGLMWSWTLLNKIFRGQIIRKHNIEFENMNTGEDGVFLFNYLRFADKIVGCKDVVYECHVRPFWASSSITQKVNLQYAKEGMTSIEKIGQYSQEVAREFLNEAKENYGVDSGYYSERLVATLNFNSEIYRRTAFGKFIKEFYRNIWRLDTETYDYVREMVEYCKNFVQPSEWKRTAGLNSDIMSKNALLTKEDMIAYPYFTFVMVSEDINQIKVFMENLYQQHFPRFQLILPASLEGSDEIATFENIVFADTSDYQNVEKHIKGQFVFFINEPVFFNKRALKDIYTEIEERPKENFFYLDMKTLKSAFEIKDLILYKDKDKIKGFTEINTLLSNKIVAREKLEGILEYLKGEDLAKTSKAIENTYILTSMMDEDFEKYAITRGAKKEYKKLIK